MLKKMNARLDMNIHELSKIIMGLNIKSETKIKALNALKTNGACELSDISPVIYELISTPSIEKEAEYAESIEEWKNVFLYSGNSGIADLDEMSQNTIIECILREQIERFNKPKEYLETWYSFLRGEVM